MGHIRAENPTADVRWLTYDRITSVDQLTGHLVVLGSGDVSTGGAVSPVKSLMDSLEIPVRARFLDSDPEFGAEFVLQLDPKGTPTFGGDQEEVFRPRFLRDESTTDRPRLLVDGAPQLNADIALIVRKSNPLNLTAKVTILSGMFSRGTYGAVRAFTDEKFRARNEQWLANANALTPENFWLLVQVSVFAGENTITPDLGRASQRLRISS